jgi:hypothetical protein
MKELSIEYAHIYTNQQFDIEQKKSVELLEGIMQDKDKKDLVFTIMIDDYSFPDPTFDYHDLITHLSCSGFTPDISIRESMLIKDCDSVLSKINSIDLKNSIIGYIKEKKKYPCSLFIATWYLIRLGCIEADFFPDALIAKKLLNILPQSFKPFEEKGFEIIKNTEFFHVLDNIENMYFEGRNI